MNQMAVAQVSAGQLTNAIALLEKVMAWQEAVPKEEEIIIIDAMNTMAEALEQRKRFSEALSLRHKVLAGYSRLLDSLILKTRSRQIKFSSSHFFCAVHVQGFFESGEVQRQWGGLCGARIVEFG